MGIMPEGRICPDVIWSWHKTVSTAYEDYEDSETMMSCTHLGFLVCLELSRRFSLPARNFVMPR